jgi:hypothetical protein
MDHAAQYAPSRHPRVDRRGARSLDPPRSPPACGTGAPAGRLGVWPVSFAGLPSCSAAVGLGPDDCSDPWQRRRCTTASLPWNATAATSPANGGPAMRQNGAVPPPRRTRAPLRSVPQARGERAGSTDRERRTPHPRVARWGVLGRAVIRGPHHPNTTTRHQEREGPRGPRGGVPGRDRTRGHKRPHPKARAHRDHKASLDRRQHQIVWLSTVHRRRPVWRPWRTPGVSRVSSGRP